MKDRIPRYAGRIKLIPIDENNGIYYMERADEPIQEGTPLNKNTLLKDETAEKVGLDNEATVDLVLNVLADKVLSIEEILQKVPISNGGTGANTLKSAKDNFGIAHIEEILKTFVFFGTLGVAYELNGDTYVCTGIGTATDSNIIISPKVGGTNVTSISDSAFIDCSLLTSVVIPDSVTSIGTYAFSGCTSLKSIEIGDSVTSIGDWAFSGCTSLKSIEIPDSATSIPNQVFRGCSALSSVVIGNSVTSIGTYPFYGCAIRSIHIPNSVTKMDTFAFGMCLHLTDIYVPWAEGEVAGAPWGAYNATVHYNSEV